MRLSATTIKDCHECVLKGYWGNVVKPIEVNPNHFGLFGTLLHWTIKEVIEHNLFDQWGIVKTMYTEKYSNLFLKNKTIEIPRDEGFYWSGLKLLYNWKKDFVERGWDKAENLMLEKYFRIPVRKNVMFSGFVDYLMKYENKIYLIDWKSNRQILTEDDIQDNIQLNMYYWAGKQFNIKPDYVGLYFLRANEYVSVTRSEDDIEYLFDQSRDVEESFSKRDIVANYSESNCKWCGFKDICDAYQEQKVLEYDKIEKTFLRV